MTDQITSAQGAQVIALRPCGLDNERIGAGACETFGLVLKRLRDGRGMTREQAAAIFGISVEWLARMEAGCIGVVNLEMIVKIRHALQIEYRDLVGFR